MPITVILLVTIAEDASRELSEYLKAENKLLKRIGATRLKRFPTINVSRPLNDSKAVIFYDFPDRPKFTEMLESAEYKSLKPLRDHVFSSLEMSVVQ